MKKILASLTAACMLLSMCALAACNGGKEPEKPVEEPHIHTFAEAWSSDETGHWHAATCEHENEISEKSEHTMSEGKCSVCGYRAPVVLTKDTDFAALVSDKVTEDEWNAAFTNEGFSGCSGRLETTETSGSETYTERTDFSYDYIQNGDVTDFRGSLSDFCMYLHWAGNLLRGYEWDEGSNYDYTWVYTDSDISTLPPEAVDMMRSEMFFVCFTTYDFSGYYQKFTYDETKGAYVFEGSLDFESAPSASFFYSYFSDITARIGDAKVEIKFADGKVAYVRICGRNLNDENAYEDTGEYPYCEETYCLFDYDGPKVDFPEDAEPKVRD